MKTNFKVKLVAAFLLLAMLVPMFACANGDNGGNDDDTTPADSSAETTTAPGSEEGDVTTAEPVVTTIANDVPTLSPDLKYGGKMVNIFTWSNQTMWEWDSTQYTGELLDDAIYKRRLMTEKDLDVTITLEKEPGDWDHRNEFIQKIAANIKTESHAYDLIGQYTPASAIGAMLELYTDLTETPNLDLTRKWWPGDITESSSINGHLYFTTGDITPTLIRNMSTVMANLDMATAYDLPNLYELVDSGEWTLDKMIEIGTDHSTSTGSDDKTYGVTITNNVIYDGLFYSGGFKFVTTNSDGTIELSQDLAKEEMADWFTACQGLLWGHEDVEIKEISSNGGFTSGKGLFHMGQISDVQNFLTKVSFKFAILPFPKMKVSGDYHTIVGYWVTMYSIPRDARDQAMSGALLESLGYQGYKEVTPVFYEVAFKYRYLDSEENARMFDLLHDTMTYDTGRTFADQVNCFSSFRQATQKGMQWTAYFTSQKDVWANNVQAIYDKLG